MRHRKMCDYRQHSIARNQPVSISGDQPQLENSSPPLCRPLLLAVCEQARISRDGLRSSKRRSLSAKITDGERIVYRGIARACGDLRRRQSSLSAPAWTIAAVSSWRLQSVVSNAAPNRKQLPGAGRSTPALCLVADSGSSGMRNSPGSEFLLGVPGAIGFRSPESDGAGWTILV